MKTFIVEILPNIKRFSQKLDNLTLLTNQHWVLIDNIYSTKTIYYFRDNNDLLISTNGKVEKAKWEYLGNKSLLIDKAAECYLFKHEFFDENILALKIESADEYAVFVNENKYNGDINSIEKVFEFLKGKYLDSSIKSDLENNVGPNFGTTQKKELNEAQQKYLDDERIRKERKQAKEELFIAIPLIIVVGIFILLMYFITTN